MKDLPPESELDRKQREGLRKRSELTNQRGKASSMDVPGDQTKIDPEMTWTAPAPESRKNRTVIFLFLILAFVTIPIAFKVINTKDPMTSPRAPESTYLLDFIENASPADLNQAIESVIRGFMTAPTNEERCRYVRGGLSHLEQMEEFYARPGIEPSSSFHQIFQTEPASFQGVPIYAVLATAREGEPALLFQIVPSQGGVTIDWEVSVGYGEMPWEALWTMKPETAQQLRVYVKRAPSPLHFPDQASYYFGFVESRESPTSITACFPKNTPLADELKKIIPPAAQQPVNLELRWNTELQLFEITRLLHNFWMSPPGEEKNSN